jgi:alpha-mannosidase
MKYEQLVILLPCHSLEDFPLHHDGDDADGLLANWTAMWHPALLASVGGMPSWCRVDDPPEQLANKLILAPSVSLHEMPTGFAQRAKGDGANLIRKQTDCDEILRQALEQLDGGDAGVDPNLAADFLALGYCYLQVELLTRQMRYSSNLDEIYFTKQVTAAAEAAVAGNIDEAKTKLQACFDVLAEERAHYYPVDAFVLDLTLVAPTTIGESLRQELKSSTPLNLLISAETASALAEQEPETLAALKQALAEQRACLIGGEFVERRLPLLSHEGLLEGLRTGLAEYDTQLGAHPHVYGRRRYGLTPALPQILHGLGFTGAIHATLDDGRFPEGTQIKTRWEGSDGTPIDAIARAPLDATKAQTFLGYAVKLGESMDSDHVATICLAHWPGQTCRWFDDLRRAARYSPALGKFITLEAYFAETDSAPHTDRFEADQYRDPYLKQAVIRRHEDPLSTSVRYWKRRAAADAAQSLTALSALASGDVGDGLGSILSELERTADDADAGDLDARIEAALDAAAQRFAGCIPRGQGPQQAGCLAANPLSFVRRVGVELEGFGSLPAIEKPICIADQEDGRTQVVVDVPPMGFAWLAPGDAIAAPPRDPKKQLAEADKDYCVLRNEFFEVIINSSTGTLQSIHEYKRRGNRLSQQLALRTQGEKPRPGDAYSDEDGGLYSEMAAESVRVTATTAALGEVVARGKLLDDQGKPVAGFQQTYRLWRGSRVLELEVELDPQAELKSDPWNNYYCLRFAWASEGAELFRGVHEARHASHAKRIVAPHYIELEDPKHRTAILTGGLPFHRLVGMRKLDSLLVVRGERERKFRVGIALDLTHPMQDALSLLAPIPVVKQTAAAPQVGTSSWLFHIDSRNVVATHWSPIVEEGRVSGFRARLLETSGRTSKVGLSTFRPAASAQRVDFAGQKVVPLNIEDGKIQLELAQRQWVEIEARF